MIAQSHSLAFLQSIGWPEMVVVGIIALLIFGKRLPEVGRSLGKSFVEFKKGLKDTGNELKQIKSDAKEADSDSPSNAKEKPQAFNDPQKGKTNADSSA